MMKQIRLGVWFMVFFVGPGLQAVLAQDAPVSLTLEEAIRQTLANNKQVNISKLQERSMQYAYRSAHAYLLPQVNFSYSSLVTDNPLNAFGFRLQQQTIMQENFNPALLNHPAAVSDFMTQLQVQQPLLNMDAVYMQKAVFKQMEAASYKTSRLKDYLVFQVKDAYLQLQMLYASKKVIEESLASFNELYRFSQNRYDQGLLQRSDVLNSEVMVKTAETNRQKMITGIVNASDRLGLLMGGPLAVVYAAPDSVKASTSLKDSVPAGRADFMAIGAALSSMDYSIKSNKAQWLPRINAFGNYQLHDASMLGFGGHGYFAGVQLSWDIFKGNTVSNKTSSLKVEKMQLSEELSKLRDESRAELLKAWRQYKQTQFEQAQQKAAVDASEEAFRVLQNRYGQGLVNTTDVLMAQTQLANQKLALAQAFFAQQIVAAYIEFLTQIN